ncbi:Hypothetical_protein [Hexamita inflata]|uniref:Hypothetical_protein n=1 Tax=Hexamita inflata TaxID=28002 RepID=A0AA86NHA9_9EUKA|nr:Hypothetical protein HINF_LOCUS6758 [Hexamita inflata]
MFIHTFLSFQSIFLCIEWHQLDFKKVETDHSEINESRKIPTVVEWTRTLEASTEQLSLGSECFGQNLIGQFEKIFSWQIQWDNLIRQIWIRESTYAPSFRTIYILINYYQQQNFSLNSYQLLIKIRVSTSNNMRKATSLIVTITTKRNTKKQLEPRNIPNQRNHTLNSNLK